VTPRRADAVRFSAATAAAALPPLLRERFAIGSLIAAAQLHAYTHPAPLYKRESCGQTKGCEYLLL
jgi:hypothetical protein